MAWVTIFKAWFKGGWRKLFLGKHSGLQLLETYFFKLPRRIGPLELSQRVIGKDIWAVRHNSYQNSWSTLSVQGISDGECNLFLNPTNRPERVNYLLTNFHLPKSTLIMLVSSFIGRERTLEIYREAVESGYRFFSYGDAMLII